MKSSCFGFVNTRQCTSFLGLSGWAIPSASERGGRVYEESPSDNCHSYFWFVVLSPPRRSKSHWRRDIFPGVSTPCYLSTVPFLLCGCCPSTTPSEMFGNTRSVI
ncbi:hypothetical protein M413DRAFT_194175 [Hebeloma cylindrosporum]|uniref:Uncharacterized protein n=1 Tax=Hebeloma cylindrosporum TaxID=76867 RepID=A0A0C2YF36_HEBCY|nr:hypothetical protein M413DRAFT_194175 [Hebeloma cylindrosporum h7]